MTGNVGNGEVCVNGQSYLVASRQVNTSQTPSTSSLISPSSMTQQWHKQNTSTYPVGYHGVWGGQGNVGMVRCVLMDSLTLWQVDR